MNKRAPPLINPQFCISLLDPNFPFGLTTNYCCTVCFAQLQVTTPHTPVPSHNNSSRRSNLPSTLYMRSSSWYDLISLKFLSLQFLAKCLYLPYNQHTLSVFPSLYNYPTPLSVPRTDCSIFRTVELTIYIYIYIHTHLAITYSSGLTVSSSQ